jgi:hypothetical protein
MTDKDWQTGRYRVNANMECVKDHQNVDTPIDGEKKAVSDTSSDGEGTPPPQIKRQRKKSPTPVA